MGVVVPDKPQKIKKLDHGWYDHVHAAMLTRYLRLLDFHSPLFFAHF